MAKVWHKDDDETGGRAQSDPFSWNDSGKTIDRSVIEAVCMGDHDSFRKVYLHSVGPLMRFLKLLLNSDSDAEDVAQDVFTYIWENTDKIDPSKSFKGYLYTIARTLSFKLLARRKLGDKYSDYKINAQCDPVISPEDMVMSREAMLMMNIYIESMPARRRRIFRMRHIDGLSDKEIAEALNVSINTVRTHQRLAMNGLRELMSVFLSLFF